MAHLTPSAGDYIINAVIGPKQKARTRENQKAEAKIGVRVPDRMTELGRPYAVPPNHGCKPLNFYEGRSGY